MSASLVLPGLLALAGSSAGNAVAWVVARQQARWREREEAMRMLRWAAELARTTLPGAPTWG
jgi:hypothetical protein